MKERRRWERKPLVISLSSAASSGIWEAWSKRADRWAEVRDWANKYQPVKKK